ncbi:hypothetical protein SIN8267_00109 [Sinobacterium norvegicum]|uniref:Alpha/beta hydrolase n=1 Tax=Sinobacterium norvegicum TaxID=1641715 RepID=A0ABM9ABQ5_9GAMM|nr:dienelactone hydrolase family protein [Sinobacterium norvegicum]CAH0990026.1 hypothetical protein SIN8267_00109 [Sinobacterium norvegicum]
MNRSRYYSAALLFVLISLGGCQPLPSGADRGKNIIDAAEQRGWRAKTIDSGMFALTTLAPQQQITSDTLWVYIEGDGLAWLSRSRPSDDPTPSTAMGLKLAMADQQHQRVYLGRPCQYSAALSTGCDKQYWLQGRFNETVVAAMDDGIEQLKGDYSAQHIVLVGYSGGGAIASLLAARRDDVSLLITVAGNLNHRQWTEIKNISPLTTSLNPIDSVTAITAPQWHFYGSEDNIMPLATLQSYQAAQPINNRMVETDNGHGCCWDVQWPQLLDRIAKKNPVK